MSYQVPTTQEIKDRNLSLYESNLGQTSPINAKAFLRVLAGVQAFGETGLYKFAAERALQCLALTATGIDLDNVGATFDVPRNAAVATQLTATLPATTGTIIPVTVGFVGDSNDIIYFPDAPATAAADIATLNLTSETAGAEGNLNVSDTLTISNQIAGILTTTATVTVIDTTGADEETDTNYRERVLDAMRLTTGGGNVADYKIWSEEVSGVEEAYPFAGRPISAGTSLPGDRTVYIEATTDIDPDGIPPTSLLDDVRVSINTDPDTGETRPPLGIPDTTLWVEPIARTAFFVEVQNLIVDTGILAAVQTQITDAIDTYLRSVEPFVEGITLTQDRNDTITNSSIGSIASDIAQANGGSVDDVFFGTVFGSWVPFYQVTLGEHAKSAGVSFA